MVVVVVVVGLLVLVGGGSRGVAVKDRIVGALLVWLWLWWVY